MGKKKAKSDDWNKDLVAFYYEWKKAKSDDGNKAPVAFIYGREKTKSDNGNFNTNAAFEKNC